jgi:hypothetical protein
VEDLRELAALFAETDKPHALGQFSLAKEATIAEWAESGELRVLAQDGRPVAAAVVSSAKAERAVEDFAGNEIARIQQGDVHIKRSACRAGAEGVLARLLEDIASAAAGAVYLELWQESKPLVAAATAAAFTWLGSSKVRASSEIVGLWARAAKDRGHAVPVADLATLEQLTLPQHDVAPLMAAIRKRSPAWADHYSTYNVKHSWSALVLRGYGGLVDFIEKPAEMSRKWKADNADKLTWPIEDTPLRALLPEAEPIIAAIPGKKHRIRLMRLTPGGGELLRHADITDQDAGTAPGRLMRIHVPIDTNPSVEFEMWRLSGRTVRCHMGTGETWYLDTRKPHRAWNKGTTERIHLVMDVESSPALLALLPAQQPDAPATIGGCTMARAADAQAWAPRMASACAAIAAEPQAIATEVAVAPPLDRGRLAGHRHAGR